MFRTTVKGLLAHKLRVVLTAISVILGVAFVAGTLVLSDTITQTFDTAIDEQSEHVDVVVRLDSGLDDAADPPLPESVLAQIAASDGVAAAVGTVSGYAQVVDADGEPITASLGTVGESWNTDPAMSIFAIAEGREPQAAGEIVVDVDTAHDHDLAVGQTVQVLTATGSGDYAIVGLAEPTTDSGTLGTTYVAFDTPTAQRALDRVGQFDLVQVRAASGVSDDALADRVTAAVGDDFVVQTSAERAEEASDELHAELASIDTFLLVFAFISLFVGAFIIFNTFSIIVTQRTREMALLRAIGASGRQVLGSVVLEALVVGAVASAIGLGVGIGVAGVLKALLAAIGLDIPTGAPVVATSTVVVSLAVGTIVTLVSAIGPARKASKVAPIAALRDAGPAAKVGSVRRTVVGGLTLAAGIAAVVAGLSGGTLPLVGVGAVLTFVGMAAVAPTIARPVSRVIGAPLARTRGITGELARQNAARSPLRTASTASALMIGVALVVVTVILGASITNYIRGSVEEGAKAEVYVNDASIASDGFSPALAAAVGQLPEVAAAYGTSSGPARVDGSEQWISAADPALWDPTNPDQGYDIQVQSGTITDLADGGIALQTDAAEDLGVTVGDVIPVEYPDGARDERVDAIFEDNGYFGRYLVSDTTYAAMYADQLQWTVFVTVADGVDADTAMTAVRDLVDTSFPGPEVQDRDAFIQSYVDQTKTIIGLISALLGLAIVIALLGVANTLALSIFERTRELGLLRAIGMTKAQLRAMVRHEAAIIATFGAALGLAVGVFFGTALVKAMGNMGIEEVVVPPGQLVGLVAATAVLGLAAAILPARKAARVDVLDALAAS
jgi:putative ABC transport system permease protein